MSLIDKEIVLCLNRNWIPIGKKTVKDAFISMCSGRRDEKPPFLGLNIEYDVDRDGQPDFDSVFKMEPLPFEEWIQLPCFAWHYKINTTKSFIRCPTVIVATNYDKILMRKPRVTKEGLWQRDGGRCIYTNKKLTKSSCTIEHIIPKSRWKERGLQGSPDNWKNLALCDKEVNHKKGSKLPEEAGLKLLWQPTEPNSVPIYSLINDARHKDWEHFLIKKEHANS